MQTINQHYYFQKFSLIGVAYKLSELWLFNPRFPVVMAVV